MYNRYIPDGTSYEQLPDEESTSPHAPNPRRTRGEGHRPPTPGAPLEGITGWLGGLVKNFHLEELDSGDILLVLILLFLFLESDDNLELVITLGLLLLFGLFGKDDQEKEQQD